MKPFLPVNLGSRSNLLRLLAAHLWPVRQSTELDLPLASRDCTLIWGIDLLLPPGLLVNLVSSSRTNVIINDRSQRKVSKVYLLIGSVYTNI